MKMSQAASLLVLLVPAAAFAGELEVGVFAGRSIPTYEQTFSYNPGSFSFPTPLAGISLAQQGSFAFTAKGGLAAGGSLAYFLTDAIGLEARLDTVSIHVDATGVRYLATVTTVLPVLPSFSTTLDLPAGVVEVDRLTPISVGLKLRTPGRVRLYLSAGGSYLPKVGVTATQSLAIGLNRVAPLVDVAQATIRAAAPAGESQGRWGGTAGVGLEVPLGARASLQIEARGFRFQTETLAWELVTPIVIPFVTNAVARIDPVEFKPTFYQATAGFAFRF